MGERIGLSFDFELEEGEKVIQESPTIVDVEFDKMTDFFNSMVGEKIKGRVLAKPFLTNRRILMWLLLVPFEISEPKSIWYTLPFENISYMRPGKCGHIGNGRKGLEMEFATPKVGGVASSIGKRLIDSGGIAGWIGSKLGNERTKIWLYLPDFPLWNMNITKMLQEKKPNIINPSPQQYASQQQYTPPAGVKYCANCGAPNPKESQFCNRCGTKLA